MAENDVKSTSNGAPCVVCSDVSVMAVTIEAVGPNGRLSRTLNYCGNCWTSALRGLSAADVQINSLHGALKHWWANYHNGDGCTGSAALVASDEAHSELCVDTAFSCGYRAGQKDASAAADRDRQFAEAVREGLRLVDNYQTVTFIDASHLRIYGTLCTTADDEKEKRDERA